jgi:hypothetical protein
MPTAFMMTDVRCRLDARVFAGFSHGAAMMRTAGVSATEFATRAVPWLTAMAQVIPLTTKAIDSPGNYEGIKPVGPR